MGIDKFRGKGGRGRFLKKIMNEEQFKEISKRLADHEARLSALESPITASVRPVNPRGEKQKTLKEIVRGKKFKNATEKLAVIVGYHEKIVGSLVKKDNLKKEWQDAKMMRTYKTNLMDDASGVYIRIQSNGECDLTQSGEDFFEKFLNDESTQATSK